MRFRFQIILFLGLLVGCVAEEIDFFKSAYGNPSLNLKVLAYHSEIVDNFFKSEHAWLLDVSGDKAWVDRLTSGELSDSILFDEESYKGIHTSRYLVSKFPEAFSDEKPKHLYFVGQSESGRSHYFLKTEKGNKVIYYISTI